MEGRFADAELLGDLGDRDPGGELLVRLAQFADDLLWGVSLLHQESYSFRPFRAFGLS